VIGLASPASTFLVTTTQGEVSVFDVAKGGSYHREFVNDPERCEYLVPIKWLQTVPLEKAVKEIGFFGNQNSVCKPTTPKWRATVERLKERFPDYGKT
jgi:hypothetical protein